MSVGLIAGFVDTEVVRLVSPQTVRGLDVALGATRRSGRQILVEVSSGYASVPSFTLTDTGALITDQTGPYAVRVGTTTVEVDPDATFQVWALGDEASGSEFVSLDYPGNLEFLQATLPGLPLLIGEEERTVAEVLSRPRVGSAASTIVIRLDAAVDAAASEMSVLQDQAGTHLEATSGDIRAGDHLLSSAGSEHIVLSTAGTRLTLSPPLSGVPIRVNRDVVMGSLLFDDQAQSGWEVTGITPAGWKVRLAFGEAQNGLRNLRVGPPGSDYTSVYEIFEQDRETPVSLIDLDNVARPFIPASTRSHTSDEGWSFSLAGEMVRTERLGMNKVALSVPARRPYEWRTSRPAVASGMGSSLATLTVIEPVRNRAGANVPVPPVGGGVLSSLSSKTRWEILEGVSSGPVTLRAKLRGVAQGPVTVGGHTLFGPWAYVRYRTSFRQRDRDFDVAEMQDDVGRALRNLGQGGSSLGPAELVVAVNRVNAVLTSAASPQALVGCDLVTGLVLPDQFVPMRVREVLSSDGDVHSVLLASPAPDTVPAGDTVPVEVVRTVIASAWSEVAALLRYLNRMKQVLNSFEFSGSRRISASAERLREARFEVAAQSVDDLDFEAWIEPYALSALGLNLADAVETVLGVLQRNRESPL